MVINSSDSNNSASVLEEHSAGRVTLQFLLAAGGETEGLRCSLAFIAITSKSKANKQHSFTNQGTVPVCFTAAILLNIKKARLRHRHIRLSVACLKSSDNGFLFSADCCGSARPPFITGPLMETANNFINHNNNARGRDLKRPLTLMLH